MTFKKRLAEMLAQAFARAGEKGLLGNAGLPEITIERPARPEHGDYAGSLPLKLARLTGMKPMDVAAAIIDNMTLDDDFEKVAAVPPGFVKFAEYGPVIWALEPWATWHVMQFRAVFVDVWRYL